MFRQQQMMLYVLPLVFAVSGVAFPLGVMTYWLISNFWTMGQQWVVIRNMPTPGSEAAKAREERLKRRGKWVEPEKKDKDGNVVTAAAAPVKPTQRQQPVSKQRAKKQGGQKAASGQGAKDEAAKPDLAKKSDSAAADGGSSTGSKSAAASGSKSTPKSSGTGTGKGSSNASKSGGKGASGRSNAGGKKKTTSSSSTDSTKKNQADDVSADEQ